MVHIGKCGGATVKAALRDAGMTDGLRVFHVSVPIFRKDTRYIIVARNPLNRAISAFNWRYKLVVVDGTQRDRFPGEYEVLTRYGSLAVLGTALFDADGTPNHGAARDARRIHHIREDIDFYLSRLLNRCLPNQIEAVLMQESLDMDIERVFGVRNNHRIHDNRDMRGNSTLSSQARANLMRFLHRDYEALTRLYAWGKIERENYIKALN